MIVSDDGNTKVDVFEGAVEVGRLDDPNDRALIEAGRGVLVRPGQALQLLGLPVAKVAPAPRNVQEREHTDRVKGPPAPPVRLAGMQRQPASMDAGQHPQPPEQHAGVVIGGGPLRKDERHIPPGASNEPLLASGLLTMTETPLLFRFNAYADLHLDAYENPAYAASASTSETRASLYGLSPQLSVVQSVGKGFVAGGTVTSIRSNSGFAQSFQSAAAVSSFSAFAARRIGQSGFGFSVERLRVGLNSASESDSYLTLSESFARQTRLTAGATTQIARQTDVGVYARYGFVQGGLGQRSFTAGGMPQYSALGATGRTTEAGVRLRGVLTPKLSYGVTANVATSTLGLIAMNSKSVAAGAGYLINSRTLISADLTAGC